MTPAVAFALLVSLQQPVAPGVRHLSFSAPNLGPMRYALSIPSGYNAGEARPLVLALHPGELVPGYGAVFLQRVVAPGLRDLGAIIVSPDCPARAWTEPLAEKAVLALLQSVLNEYSIDRSRVLVTGFSMGGRGTWFMATQHADLFTAAIPMAGAPGDVSIDRLATMPTYVIHSRDDNVVPFAPSEKIVADLKRLGRPVELEALDGVPHSAMGGYVGSLRRAGRWVAEQWTRRSPGRLR